MSNELHRVTWFAPNRPVEGTVYVKPEESDDPFGTTCVECGEAIDDARPYGALDDGNLAHFACCDDAPAQKS